MQGAGHTYKVSEDGICVNQLESWTTVAYAVGRLLWVVDGVVRLMVGWRNLTRSDCGGAIAILASRYGAK